MENRTETCQLCGEPNVEILECDELPEDLQGSACKNCCDFHIEEANSKSEIDKQQRLDKIEDAIMDSMLNGDF